MEHISDSGVNEVKILYPNSATAACIYSTRKRLLYFVLLPRGNFKWMFHMQVWYPPDGCRHAKNLWESQNRICTPYTKVCAKIRCAVVFTWNNIRVPKHQGNTLIAIDLCAKIRNSLLGKPSAPDRLRRPGYDRSRRKYTKTQFVRIKHHYYLLSNIFRDSEKK